MKTSIPAILLAVPVLAFLLAAAMGAESAFSDGRAPAIEAEPAGTAALDAGTIKPSHVFTRAQVSSAGVGLRNRGGGAIRIAEVEKPVRQAFLYWGVITRGPAPDAVKSLRIQRIIPQPAPEIVEVPGTVVGIGPDPCRKGANGGDTITIFRGIVPLAVATGNGTYLIRFNPSTSGKVPFSASPLPAWSGASLVIVGSGEGTVSLYDSGLAGKTFVSRAGIAYTLPLGADVSKESRVVFHSIGADGQSRDSLKPSAATAAETMTFNGMPIASMGSARDEGDENGKAAPLPQLWDDSVRDITAAAEAATGDRLAVRIQAPPNGHDCLTPVANIVAAVPLSAEERARRRRPDLVIGLGQVLIGSPDKVVVGREEMLADWGQRTDNIGQATALRSRTAVLLVDSATGISQFMATLPIPKLAPGRRHLSSGRFAVDFEDRDFATYPIDICADSSHLIRESNEDNNCKRLAPIHLVPKRIKGTITGKHTATLVNLTLSWTANVSYDFARARVGNAILIDYVFDAVAVVYTLQANLPGGCTYNGTGTYRPPVQALRLWFNQNRFLAENTVASTFNFPITVRCPNAPPINIPYTPPAHAWFATNGYKPYQTPLDVLADSYVFNHPGGIVRYTWNLKAE